MNKFIEWYRNYYSEITWFIIGILFVNGLEALAREDYPSVLLDSVLIYANYYFWTRDVR